VDQVGQGVLIIGQGTDPHVQRVQGALENLGICALILDPYPSDRPCKIAIAFDEGQCEFQTACPDVTLARQDVTAVWWRLKPGPEWPNQSAETLAMQRFSEREWQHALEVLEAVLASAYWINPRRADRRARHKLVQLIEATRQGFTIPPTVIANDAEKVLQRVRAWDDQAIYKPLSWYFPPPDKILYTSQIDSQFVKANAESVGTAPGIFQPRIEKAFELRITVVGEAIFPVKIESQGNRTTQLDWRRDYDVLSYALFELPQEMAAKLLRLHAALGLIYGAYDFIVTPEGEFVFLEVNPLGQWLWLEDALGIGVTGALARLLGSSGR